MSLPVCLKCISWKDFPLSDNHLLKAFVTASLRGTRNSWPDSRDVHGFVSLPHTTSGDKLPWSWGNVDFSLFPLSFLLCEAPLSFWWMKVSDILQKLGFTVPHSTVIYNWYGFSFSFSVPHNSKVPSFIKKLSHIPSLSGFHGASFVTALYLNITNKVIIYSEITNAFVWSYS